MTSIHQAFHDDSPFLSRRFSIWKTTEDDPMKQGG